MKSLSVKRINLVVLCGILLFAALIFTGCNSSGNKSYEEQGYTAVYRVTYSSGTGSTTLYSRYKVSVDYKEITKEECDSLDYKYIQDYHLTYGEYRGNGTYSIYGNVKNDNSTEYKLGEKYKQLGEFDNSEVYFELTISDVTINYIYVKPINENSFELIDTDGSQHLINTTYYHIEYFI